MRLKGLKLSISFHFAVLLAIGMLLLNFVIISLWQQHIVTGNLKQARMYLSILGDSDTIDCQDTISILEEIEKKQSNIDFVIKKENNIVHLGTKDDSQVLKLLQRAIQSQSAVNVSMGNILSLWGWRAKDIVVAGPVEVCGDDSAVGIVLRMEGIYRGIFDKQSFVMVYVLVNVIILTTIGFFRMRRIVIQPLENLVRISESIEITGGDFLTISPRNNEFGHVATALHNMLSRIENNKEKLNATISSLEKANTKILANQKTLIEAEKFAAVGRLSAGLAHEIGNPLGIILGYIELLEQDDISPQDRRQYSSRAIKELNRVTALIHQLLGLARKKRYGESRSVISEVIHEVVDMFRYQKSADAIQFKIDCESFSERVCCSEADLQQVLLNCLLNAIDAIREEENAHGTITLSCNLLNTQEGKFVEVRISDDGGGIDEADMSVVFDPFFTTKEVGHGTGLGLSVSRTIIENNGGTIHLESKNSSGTCVIIRLPLE